MLSLRYCVVELGGANAALVNGILLHHNIEKQMSDSRGEVAYLMADISEVKEAEIKDLFQSLQELSCKYLRCGLWRVAIH